MLVGLLIGCGPLPAGEGAASVAADTAEPAVDADTGTGSEAACDVLSAALSASRLTGSLPLTVELDAAGSCGPSSIVSYEWDIDGVSEAGMSIDHTWLGTGEATVSLTVTDAAGSTATAQVAITPTAASCPEIETTQSLGSLSHDELDESSGLILSRSIPDLMWSHNDSGDDARLFALGLDGRHRGIFVLEGIEAQDWEDSAISVDPETGEGILLIGDIGDNDGNRASVTVFMVPEPAAAMLDAEDDTVLTDFSVLSLIYPDDRALNADTLLADPQTGALYLLAEDEDDQVVLFRKPAPHVADTTTTLEEVLTLDIDYPTGGAFSPLGDQLMLRTADSGHLWLRDATFELADALEAGDCSVPIAEEARGESVDFVADGSGYITTSEEAHQPVWHTAFHREDPCSGLEARVLGIPADAEVPLEVTLQADPHCVPEGIASVAWVIDGESSDADQPSQLFTAAGEVPIRLTVTDTTGAVASVETTLTLSLQECPAVGDTQTWGALQSEEIPETSGVVVSARSEDVLWVHNDSGDSARLFALATDGALLGTYTLDISPRDWEDLAAGWNEELGSESLYIGDIGDNSLSRSSISVLVLPEPAVDSSQAAVSEAVTDFSTLTLTYPDSEAHNCETLAYDPRTGSLIIVTKSSDGESHIFEKPAPHQDGTSTELTWLSTLQFGSDPLTGSANTTSGAFSSLGDRFIIRTYSDAWIWIRDGAESLAEALAGEVCDAGSPSEPQGEAIGFAPDGSGYVTISEGVGSAVLFTPLQ